MQRIGLAKIASTLGIVIALLFGGAGVFYGIEGQNELRETGSIEEWKYLNCIYFCTVTLTTIGYGDITPTTSGGKVFVVFYAIICLGVMAAAITTIGQIIVLRANQEKNEFIKVTKMFTKKLKKLAHLSNTADIQLSVEQELNILDVKKERGGRWYIRLVGLILLIFLTVLIGAVAFHSFEGWTYGNCVYFCFITLLTIGYGDFSPQTDHGRIFFIFYVLIGLGLLAFIVGDIGEKILSQTHQELQEAKIKKALLANLHQLQKLKHPKLRLPHLPPHIIPKKKSKSSESQATEKNKNEGKVETMTQNEQIGIQLDVLHPQNDPDSGMLG